MADPIQLALTTMNERTYTFYIQHELPGKEKEAIWLPAPDGPFYTVMRVHGPSKEAQDGVWKAPKPVKVN